MGIKLYINSQSALFFLSQAHVHQRQPPRLAAGVMILPYSAFKKPDYLPPRFR